MYVFGATRKPELLPGCESKLMRALVCQVLAADSTLHDIAGEPSDGGGK